MEEVPSSNYESIVAEKIRRRDWDEVPTYYSMMSCADATMNCDGDTVLHLAISDRLYDIVKKLLRSLRDNPSMLERVLIAKDGNGDTPLHIAANSRHINFSEDIVDYFRLTGKPEKQLIMARNKDGETPLFLAIDHDHESVFDYLSPFVCFEEEDECGYKWWRRKDATTILHVAIMSEHFNTWNLQAEYRYFDEQLRSYPRVYTTWVDLGRRTIGRCFQMKRVGPSCLQEVIKKAKTHFWANVVMKELIGLDNCYREWRNDREETMVEIQREAVNMETPFLIAAKTGITEMVQEILERFPNAIFDSRPLDRRNVLLIAVEKRRVDLWDYFKDKYQDEKYSNWKTVLNKFDKDGNNALHIAAMHSNERPWRMPGEMMKMHWDAKWFEYVAMNVPGSFRRKRNKGNKTPKEVFNEVHKEQQKKDVTEWLNATAQACSVVAALIATVAYASASTVPGGNRDDTGKPNFMKYKQFYVFLITTFIALSFSVSSIICFLALLISGQRPSDYSTRLPRSLMWGLSTLIISVVAMFASFCAGQFLYFDGKRVPFLLSSYIVCFTVVIIVQIAHFPFFLGLIETVFWNKPQPCYSDDMVR